MQIGNNQMKENMKKTKPATEMKRILLIPLAGLLLAGWVQAKGGTGGI